MEKLQFKGTEDTPEALLDKDAGKFEISGESFPEDVKEVYNPILEWLEEYQKDPNSQTDFVFKYDYFNTASAKMIFDILSKLEEIHQESGGVTVYWYYPSNDDDIKDAGEQYEELVEVPFRHISYEEE